MLKIENLRLLKHILKAYEERSEGRCQEKDGAASRDGKLDQP
ncbi:unnamed protein product [Arabidopsis halleri]